MNSRWSYCLSVPSSSVYWTVFVPANPVGISSERRMEPTRADGSLRAGLSMDGLEQNKNQNLVWQDNDIFIGLSKTMQIARWVSIHIQKLQEQVRQVQSTLHIHLSCIHEYMAEFNCQWEGWDCTLRTDFYSLNSTVYHLFTKYLY